MTQYPEGARLPSRQTCERGAMKRRKLASMIGSAMALPLIARAQKAAMPLIGFLASGSIADSAAVALRAAFREGLAEIGYIEDRNIAISYRGAQGHYERLPVLAADLVALGPAVIVTTGSPASLAAIQVTKSIPIVFLSPDPAELGLVASYSHPGGNVTGASLYSPELTPKRLELLRELFPNASIVAVLSRPGSQTAVSQLAQIRAAAQSMKLELQVFDAGNAVEIERAYALMAERLPHALLVSADSFFTMQREQIVALAARHRIPAIYEWREHAVVGGLVSYGASLPDLVRILGVYAGRILKGARPADLPVQQPTRFELVINLKTAKALGLTIPLPVLARADEVIE
jgi:putative ABC transport system substrate-binding protein